MAHFVSSILRRWADKIDEGTCDSSDAQIVDFLLDGLRPTKNDDVRSELDNMKSVIGKLYQKVNNLEDTRKSCKLIGINSYGKR